MELEEMKKAMAKQQEMIAEMKKQLFSIGWNSSTLSKMWSPQQPSFKHEPHCQLILRAKTVLTHACIFVYLYLYLNVYFGEVALSIDLESKNCVDPRSKLLHLSDKLSCQTKLYLYVQCSVLPNSSH